MPHQPNPNATNIKISYSLAGATALAMGGVAAGASTLPERPAMTDQGMVGEPMTITEQSVDTKIALTEARTDTKFAQLMGKMDVFASDLRRVATDISELKVELAQIERSASNTKATIIGLIIGSALAIVGLTYAAVSIFASSMSATASAYQSGATASQPKP